MAHKGFHSASSALSCELSLDDEPETEDEKVYPTSSLSPMQIEQLVVDHIDMAHRLAWSLLNRWHIRLGEDDVRSATGAALCEAANRFDVSRGVSFRTFLFYHLRGVLLKEIARRVHDQQVVASDPVSSLEDAESIGFEWANGSTAQLTPEQLLIKEQMAAICRQACAQLDALEQDIIFRFFVLDQSVVDIARDLGYCRCHISRIKSQVLTRLSSQLGHLSDRYDTAVAEALPGLVVHCASKQKRSYTGGRGRRKRHLLAD